MREIEVKFLEVNVPDLKKKLKRLGAKKIFGPTLFRVVQFKHPKLGSRYFTLLRLRQEGRDLVLATKKNISSGRFKTEKEQEIHLKSSLAEARKLLESMGFVVSRENEKFREEYEIRGMEIEIDRYPKMKPYLEIEGPSKKDIRALAKELGLDFKKASSKNASQVIEGAGLNPNKLLFRKRH